jgi:hypothetical protein
LRIRTKNLHLLDGRIIPKVVVCIPGRPLEILPYKSAADIILDDTVHVALAGVDPHVHARESYIPSREEFEEFKHRETDYDATVAAINHANEGYDVYRTSRAALKGGVWLIGCMGNTPWGPIGEHRWKRTLELYRRQAFGVFTHVWPRMEPGVPMIAGQEGKDFGSTYGGSGLSAEERSAMYELWRGGDVSFHNDKARDKETIAEFFSRSKVPLEQKFHMYFNGPTVLASQEETIALARQHQVRSLRARHVPTGRAFQMLLDERAKGDLLLPIEIGLAYLAHNRNYVVGHLAGMINYRRPALPAKEQQELLIELLRQHATDPTICIGSDHAPHRKVDKEFKNGLPGSPGTRILEQTTAILCNLHKYHKFSWHKLDLLSAVHPARYMEQYMPGAFPYPIGKMEDGAMCNLRIFDPHLPYVIDEAKVARQLKDPEYHTPFRGELLRGGVLFIVVNGRVIDVRGDIKALN